MPYHYHEEIDEATKIAHALAAASAATSSICSTPAASLDAAQAHSDWARPASLQVLHPDDSIPEMAVVLTHVETASPGPSGGGEGAAGGGGGSDPSQAALLEDINTAILPPDGGGGGGGGGGALELSGYSSGAKEPGTTPSVLPSPSANSRLRISGLSSATGSSLVEDELLKEEEEKAQDLRLEREESIVMLETVSPKSGSAAAAAARGHDDLSRWANPSKPMLPGEIGDDEEDSAFALTDGFKPTSTSGGRIESDISIDDEMLMATIISEQVGSK